MIATGEELLAALVRGELPDQRGRYGPWGGRFVPETLVDALDRLETAWRSARVDERFRLALHTELAQWAGRPTPLTHARRTSDRLKVDVWLKREDLAHTGAHKINNAVGQVALARHLGAARVVAETGAGQHGVATAAACARAGMPCTVYMGAVDVARQATNVERMLAFGSEVVPVSAGDATLRAAIDEALRDWVSDPEGTYYLLGSAVGPHPYPWIVRELQSVIGVEARHQLQERAGALPDVVVACVGGGSNAIGLFHPFLGDASVSLVGVEAEGAASLTRGQPGVLHGSATSLLQDEDGQVLESHTVSAGLDYSAVGPEHALLRDLGRVRYVTVSDRRAVEAFRRCSLDEGILPALEPAHALARALDLDAELVLVGLSGRGDKDLAEVLAS